MRKLLLSTALCVAAPICLATAANAQQNLAQQTVTFLCAAPTGHVCQFGVQTGGSQINFALPSGERKEMAGRHAACRQILCLRPRPGDARLQGAPSRPLVPGLLARRRHRPQFSERQGARPRAGCGRRFQGYRARNRTAWRGAAFRLAASDRSLQNARDRRAGGGARSADGIRPDDRVWRRGVEQ